MANELKWGAAWASSTLVASGSSVNSAAFSAASSEYDNSTGLNQFGKVEITPTYASAPTAGQVIEVYMVTAPDGTNYEDGESTGDPQSHQLVGVLPLRAVTSAQRICTGVFPLQPAKTKMRIKNGSSTTLSSGWVLKLFVANDEIQ